MSSLKAKSYFSSVERRSERRPTEKCRRRNVARTAVAIDGRLGQDSARLQEDDFAVFDGDQVIAFANDAAGANPTIASYVERAV
jgi:hypothetical protein